MLTRSGTIEAHSLTFPDQFNLRVTAVNKEQDETAERAFLVQALENARWNRRQAAKDLGIPYATLRYKMDRMNIK